MIFAVIGVLFIVESLAMVKINNWSYDVKKAEENQRKVN